MKRFSVTADHKVAKHACKDASAECGQNPSNGKWYATMRDYGCSKDYSTPERAIREMLADHACTNIRIIAL